MKNFLEFNGELSKLSKTDLKELLKELKTYQLSHRETLGIPENNSFGVEIEFEGPKLKEVAKEIKKKPEYRFWGIHEDSSVITKKDGETYGGEISSDILHDRKEDLDNLYNIFLILQILGAKATNATAFHIHVGAQILGEDLKYLKRLIKVWCIYENIAFRFGYGWSSTPRDIKKINIFAMPIMPIYKDLYRQDPKIFDKLDTVKCFDFGKRNAIAFHNYHYLSSEEEVNNDIEIRCPNGTIDPLIAENNLNFYLKLILYVTSPNYDEKLINRLFSRTHFKSLENYSSVCLKEALSLSDLIFNNSKDKIDFLKQYIKDEEVQVR